MIKIVYSQKSVPPNISAGSVTSIDYNNAIMYSFIQPIFLTNFTEYAWSATFMTELQ